MSGGKDANQNFKARQQEELAKLSVSELLKRGFRAEACARIDELQAENEKMKDLVRKARQLADIAEDWNLDEVEIDGEMVEIYNLREEFKQALKGGEK